MNFENLKFKLGLTLNQIFLMLKIAITERIPSLSKVYTQFNKFKIGVEDLKDLHRTEHPITES